MDLKVEDVEISFPLIFNFTPYSQRFGIFTFSFLVIVEKVDFNGETTQFNSSNEI